MRTTMRHPGRLLIALLSGATFLSACGSDDTTATPPPAETTAVATVSTSGVTSTVVDTVVTTNGAGPVTGGSDRASGTAVLDLCTLLSPDDIADALGAEVDQVPTGTPDDFNGAFPGCAWGEYVKVYVGLTEGWMSSEGTEPLDGVGHRAFYDSQWHRVAVQSGGERFFVVLGLLASGDDLTMLKPLAQDVIAHLPA